MGGWFKVHRSLFDHPRANDPAWLAVWLRLLNDAAYEPQEATLRGRTVTLQRGQLLTTLRELERASGVYMSKVRRVLLWMEDDGQIIFEKNGATTLISIVNYEKYQGKKSETLSETLFETELSGVNGSDETCSDGKFGKVKHFLKHFLKQNLKQNGSAYIREEVLKKGKAPVSDENEAEAGAENEAADGGGSVADGGAEGGAARGAARPPEKQTVAGVAEWLELYGRFRRAHPQAERVAEVAFLAKCRAYPDAGPADVGRAIDALAVEWSGASFSTYVTPLKELGRYLARAVGGRDPAGRFEVPDFSKKDAGRAPPPRKVFEGYGNE